MAGDLIASTSVEKAWGVRDGTIAHLVLAALVADVLADWNLKKRTGC